MKAPSKKEVYDIFFGDYDYKFLCTPQWPWCQTQQRRPARFFPKDESMAVLVALVMGLQHALAMIGGLITPPLIMGFMSNGDTTVQQYLVCAALIVASIATCIQVTSIPIWPAKGIRLGSGVLSVMGISFAFVPIAQSVVSDFMADGHTFNQSYGQLLGTLALCAPIPMIISRLPARFIRRAFPPVVIGVTIMLIGINLCGVGIAAWGGGAVCSTDQSAVCFNNGDVKLPFGSPQYVGLGFSVFATIVMVELFGSPFMRNCSVIIGLMVGYIIAAVATHEGKHYVTTGKISKAPAFTFLWTTTFPLKLHGPAVIPIIIGYVITSLETIGDVTATEEASFLETEGPEHEQHVTGGLLNDGFSCLLGALSGVMPVTTFAQNNGVIALTRCASRSAGYAAAFWLMLAGVVAKFGAWVLTIPDCVLGGMTTFLFANVIVSGIKIMISDTMTRRNRFISAISLALGVGVTLKPQWATWNLWPETDSMSGFVSGINQAVKEILSTGFCLAAVVAMILHLLLPMETDTAMLEYDLRQASKRLEASRHVMASDSVTSADAPIPSKADEAPEPEAITKV